MAYDYVTSFIKGYQLGGDIADKWQAGQEKRAEQGWSLPYRSGRVST